MPNNNRDRYDPNTVFWGPNARLPETLDEQEAFDQTLERHFPREAAVRVQYGMDRRTFMKLMGASLALAGLGVGCTARPPDEKIIPYVQAPEQVVPGKPLFFASSMTLGGFATGLLIETQSGRPTRVDGNPRHSASMGASSTLLQGSILELYNPERSTTIRREQSAATWDEFLAELSNTMSNANGASVRVLTETTTSPTMLAQLAALQEMYPGLQAYQYDPISRDTLNDGARLAFDEPVNTIYQFEAADVVVSLDADFFSNMPGSLRYVREFTARRKVRGGAENANMNRMYAVESSPTITGAMAEHRLALRPSEVESFARALANALGIEAVEVPNGSPWPAEWLDTLVDDLQDNAGSSLIIVGNEQPPIVHALAHAMNAALGNVGTTVRYTAPIETNADNQTAGLAELVSDMQSGSVQALFILGGNPAYNAPSDLGFAEALAQVPFSVHLAAYVDETSRLATWHLPQTHYVEEWSDARGFDGTLSIVQPPIGALYDTVHSAHEVLAAMMNDEQSGYEIVRATWQDAYEGDDFEAYWRETLHFGVATDSAAEDITPNLRGDFDSQIAEIEPANTNSTLEIIFRPDPNIWDGRFAHNTWLQELPHPITKLAWDNAALMSLATAEDLDVENEDLIELSFEGQTMTLPVWIVPGHANGAVTVFLGYGRGLSAEVEDDRSFNAYAIRPSTAMWSGGGLSVSRTDEQYQLVSIRGQIDPENLESDYNDLPVRHATVGAYAGNPDVAHAREKTIPMADAYPDFDYSDGYSWGMTIDLSACVGCNACMIACQSENNIPTVGKEQVALGREMHWIRVDRYYEDAPDADEIATYFQPVPCMHCEKAPCEQVCPVEATVHDSEGLNNMVYNRCIGTRYCSANCPYNVRRFNFLQYVEDDNILQEQRNPNVSVRPEGVMEKCTYCVQRISAARIDANNADREILDGEVMPACASACPAQAISFGNLNDENAEVVALKAEKLNYGLLEELGTVPRTTYLARLSNPNDALYEAPAEEE